MMLRYWFEAYLPEGSTTQNEYSLTYQMEPIKQTGENGLPRLHCFWLGVLSSRPFFALVAYDPAFAPNDGPAVGGFEFLIENPDPWIRVPVDGFLALMWLAFGIFALWLSSASFRIDRWKPPVDNRSFSSRAEER
jgi:hypothetical protein